MATITRFEDLEIWQLARQFSKEICRLAEREIFKKDYKLKMQIKGSAGSAMDNIAEGFEREGNGEFKQFLYISKGSAGETRSQLYRAFDNNFIEENEFNQLKTKAEYLSVKIKNFINYLETTEIKGRKYKK
ncbi:MAG: four helix bundle protein [Bergeyella sp.]